MFKNDKLLGTFTILLFTIGLGCIIYVVYLNFNSSRPPQRIGQTQCIEGTPIIRLKDNALEGIANEGSKMKVLYAYYKCNPISRGDLVYYQFSDAAAPVVRIIRGVPGDSYDLEKIEGSETDWRVFINNKEVESKNGPFFVRAKVSPPLKTYSQAKKGILQKNEYILLSFNPPSTSDSSNLGLVKQSEILGKVIYSED